LRCWTLNLLLAASPAAAECIDPARALPAQAVAFADGARIEVLGRQGDVVDLRTFLPGEPPSTMKAHLGLFPLLIEGEGYRADYTWQGTLPDRAALAPGENFVARADGVTADGGRFTQEIALLVLAAETVTLDGCPVPVLRLMVRTGPADHPLSVSERLVEPVSLLPLSVTTTVLSSDGAVARQRSFRATALE
jgi:hypothetical protein